MEAYFHGPVDEKGNKDKEGKELSLKKCQYILEGVETGLHDEALWDKFGWNKAFFETWDAKPKKSWVVDFIKAWMQGH